MMTKAPINWTNTLFLTLTPIGALILVPYYALTVGFNFFELSVFAAYMAFTGLSITAGYHRLWSHKAYRTHFIFRLFYAIWGATSCQNSVLMWASDHRSHHRFVDHEDRDPYSATRGFFYSHMGWVMRNYPRHVNDLSNVKDLQKDPIVAWQHKYYWLIAVVTNGVIPLLLGFAIGRPFGVFILAFFLRVVLNHHFTFFINSLAHFWGAQPYSDQHTGRDNSVLALITYGEGFHNFHHTFQHDYRNGVRWWHFDPSKWLIRSCSWVGLAANLKQASKVQIEKAKLQMELKKALAKVGSDSESERIRTFLQKSYDQFVADLNAWTRVKKDWYQVKRAALAEGLERIELRNQYLALKAGLRVQRRQWRLLLADLAIV